MKVWVGSMSSSALPNRRVRAYLALVVGVICIAWTAIFVRWADVPGPTSGFYRVAFAALALIPVRAFSRKAQKPTKRGAIAAAVAGSLFACDLVFYNTSILTTSAASATLIGNNAPLFVAIGGWLLWREKPAPSFWPGLLLATVGLLAIVGADFLRDPELGRGDAMAMVSAVCYAGYFLSLQKGRSGCDPLTFNAISTGVSASLLLVFCLAFGLPLAGFGWKSWASMAALGFFTQLGGYLCVAYAMGQLSATTTSVSLLAQAPLTALMAVPLLGEALSWGQLVGGAFVLGGIWVINRGEQTPAPAPLEAIIQTAEEHPRRWESVPPRPPDRPLPGAAETDGRGMA